MHFRRREPRHWFSYKTDRTSAGSLHPATQVTTTLLAAMAAMALNRFLTLSQPLFFAAFAQTFERSTTAVAAVFSIAAATHAFATPATGLLATRLGSLRVLAVGGALVGLGLLFSSWAPELTILYLSYGIVLAAGRTMIGFVPIAGLVSTEYPQRKGAALGSVFFVALALAVLLTPLTQWVIDLWGWRWALATTAVIALATVQPLALLAMRRSHPGAIAPAEDGFSTPLTPRRASAILRSMARPPMAWLGLAHAGIGLTIGGGSITLIAHLGDRGIQPAQAALALSALILAASIGSLVGGTVSDRLGRELTYSLAGTLKVLALVGLMGASMGRPWLVYLAMVVYGLGWGGTGTVEGAIVGDLFPDKEVPSRLGILEALTGAFGSGAVLITALLHDRYGSYSPGLAVAALAVCLSTLAYWQVGPRRHPKD